MTPVIANTNFEAVDQVDTAAPLYTPGSLGGLILCKVSPKLMLPT
jgi:hypothetical protein